MLYRSTIGALAVALALTIGQARAWDDAKYPDWSGQWFRLGPAGFNGTRFDPSKPPGRGQEAPLTAEYQALFEANAKDQGEGGQGNSPTYTCLSPGMPRATNGYGEIEFVITPETTYILVQHILDDRRIFTDGRDWPAELRPTFLGYTIGKWVDTDGDGRYDELIAETRHFKGPRTFNSSGIPLHKDGLTVVRERIFLDQTDTRVLHNEVTVVDNALTRPWTVLKSYRRDLRTKPFYWREVNCAEQNNHVVLGKENYWLSADGFLMPARKNQPPPDLRYFDQSRK